MGSMLFGNKEMFRSDINSKRQAIRGVPGLIPFQADAVKHLSSPVPFCLQAQPC